MGDAKLAAAFLHSEKRANRGVIRSIKTKAVDKNLPAETIITGSYKLRSNELGIMKAIDKILAHLERHHGLDLMIVHVTNERGLVAPDGQALPSQQELSLRVFTKDKGQWRVAAFHNTMIRPFDAVQK